MSLKPLARAASPSRYSEKQRTQRLYLYIRFLWRKARWQLRSALAHGLRHITMTPISPLPCTFCSSNVYELPCCWDLRNEGDTPSWGSITITRFPDNASREFFVNNYYVCEDSHGSGTKVCCGAFGWNSGSPPNPSNGMIPWQRLKALVQKCNTPPMHFLMY